MPKVKSLEPEKQIIPITARGIITTRKSANTPSRATMKHATQMQSPWDSLGVVLNSPFSFKTAKRFTCTCPAHRERD
jgi:hypothetical protein